MAGGYSGNDAAVAGLGAETNKEALQLLDQGYIVVKNVIAPADCDALLSHALAVSDEGKRLGRGDLFGNIQESDNRRDLKLDLCIPVINALNQVGERCRPIWRGVMGERVRVVELASITADPGAVAQPVHADTMHGVTRFLQSDLQLPATDEGREEELMADDDATDDLTSVVRAIATDTALIYTCLVALQDVEADMGPTHVWPGTNTVEHHATLWGTNTSGKLHVPEADKAFGIEHKDMTLRKGDLVMYDSRTMHCGGANTSQKRRSVMVVSTMGPGIRPDGTTWTILKSLRNRLLVSDLPLPLDMATSPAADPASGNIVLPPPPEETAAADSVSRAADNESHKSIPPLEEWEACVQCTICTRWRPSSAADAPKFVGATNGFSCPMNGFSCLQEQVYSGEAIDAALG